MLDEVEAPQHPLDLVASLGLGHALEPQSGVELVGDRVGDELVLGVLEHEADAAGAVARVGPLRVDAEHVDEPAGARDDARDRLQQRGLAGAVRADDGEEVAGCHVEVDAVHDDRPAAAAAAHGHVADA